MKPDTPAAAYLHHPTLQGETLVFVADDDLWRVGADGGVAVRLTAGLGEPATPQLSPDGRWIAYAGRDEQHSEVWLIAAAGGQARRLTWLGSELAVRGWAPDGRIVFTSNHGQPFFRNNQAFLIAPEGGVPERVPLGPIDHLAFGPGGRRVIGRNTADLARWKRYRGGRAGHLWIEGAAVDGRFRRMTELAGNVTSPMWLNGRVYFLGDGQGVGNLYSVAPDGSGLVRQTDHGSAAELPAFYARHAGTDGRRIVYQCGGDLWLHDAASGLNRRVEIAVPSARTQCARRHLNAEEHIQGIRLHPAGHSLALELRGQLHTLALWEGAPQRHGPADARCRLGQWLADGKTLVAVSDGHGEHGDERIVSFTSGQPGRVLPWAAGRIKALAASSHGTQLALANHRHELWVGDAAAPADFRRVDHSDSGAIEELVFSPCGGWLAYKFPTSPRHSAIKLLELASQQAHIVSQPGAGTDFVDHAPAFDPAGRYLYFLSLRTFDPVYDAVQFELSFPRAARPYLVALQADGSAPFEPTPRGLHESKDDADMASGGAPPRWPPIEPAGAHTRIAAFPVPEGRFGQIAGVAGGKVVWSQLPLPGAHGRGGHKDGPGRIEVFDFATGEVRTLSPKADHFVLAADHRTLVLRHDKRLQALDASRKPDDKAKPADTAAPPSRDSGVIDLGRIKLAVDPPQEWTQMLREVWRLQREQFWTADMSGIDWPAVYARYAPLLARVATRGELSDLIWELQGELGTSHAYEMGGDHRKPPATALGFLAAELAPVDGGAAWEIRRIVEGDRWDAAASSPLHAVGVRARVGERIVAVSGRPLSLAEPPQALLLRQGGAKVALTLAEGAGGSGTVREVVVTALVDETPARYREWVEGNRARIHRDSAGRVGYLHLPDMMATGFAEFHRYFGTECDRDGLIVDLRYNRGGHVSQLLLEKVARRRIAWNHSRWGRPEPYPTEAAAGPVVALANEHSGSDGDIFSHNFKLMGIGPLVGTRTWGGVIGIWPRHRLADGSETTQPEYSFWFKDVGWAVENFGTEPTVPIDNAPHDDAHGPAGHDRQLQAALREALAAIDSRGVDRPAFGPRPVLAVPVLPPRGG